MAILYFLTNRYYFTVGILLYYINYILFYYSYIVPYFLNIPNTNVDGMPTKKKILTGLYNNVIHDLTTPKL